MIPFVYRENGEYFIDDGVSLRGPLEAADVELYINELKEEIYEAAKALIYLRKTEHE